MVQIEEREAVTVADALKDRVNEFRELVAWASGRLNRAAVLAVTATEGPAPGKEPDVYHTALFLGLAEDMVGRAAVAVEEAMKADPVVNLACAACHAWGEMEIGDTWDPDNAGRMTIKQLEEGLKAESASTA